LSLDTRLQREMEFVGAAEDSKQDMQIKSLERSVFGEAQP